MSERAASIGGFDDFCMPSKNRRGMDRGISSSKVDRVVNPRKLKVFFNPVL